MVKLQLIFIFAILQIFVSSINAGVVAGRSVPKGRNAGVTIKMGQIAGLEASVKDRSQNTGFLRQDYSLKDFGVEGGYVTYGLSADKAWKFFGVQFDLLYFGISEDINAQQSYNINIDSGGIDYLHVEANTDIKAEFSGGVVELAGLFTPISIELSDTVSFTPWVSMGLLVLGGNYDLDNGKTTATVSYGGLSESFSVGGSASGKAGFVVPEVGFGGEVRIGAENNINFVLDVSYSILPMGDTFGQVVSEQSGATDVSLDYFNAKINGWLEFPCGDKGRAWLVGVQYESMDASSDMDLDDGRFKKNVDINMTILTGSIGLRF